MDGLGAGRVWEDRQSGTLLAFKAVMPGIGSPKYSPAEGKLELWMGRENHPSSALCRA